MESLKGFLRRHAGMSKAAFLAACPYPFLASPPPGPGQRDQGLFPGAWIVPLEKKDTTALDPSISLGRGTENDLWIDDGSVSKQHCYFLREDDLFQIADANSTNGTFVNGHPLAPHVPLTLRSGDRIGIGESILFHFLFPGHVYDSLIRRVSEEKPAP